MLKYNGGHKDISFPHGVRTVYLLYATDQRGVSCKFYCRTFLFAVASKTVRCLSWTSLSEYWCCLHCPSRVFSAFLIGKSVFFSATGNKSDLVGSTADCGHNFLKSALNCQHRPIHADASQLYVTHEWIMIVFSSAFVRGEWRRGSLEVTTLKKCTSLSFSGLLSSPLSLWLLLVSVLLAVCVLRPSQWSVDQRAM